MNAWLPVVVVVVVVVVTLANELPYTIIGGQMANCEHLNMLSQEVLSSTSTLSKARLVCFCLFFYIVIKYPVGLRSSYF